MIFPLRTSPKSSHSRVLCFIRQLSTDSPATLITPGVKSKTSLRGTAYNFQDTLTSIRYLESESYKQAYGNKPVWFHYRRNFKSHFGTSVTRKYCVSKNLYVTGNPCPICRDEYLVIDYTNVNLIKQFVCPETDALLDTGKTHVCKAQHLMLQVALEKAKRHGWITYRVPIRQYDYSIYYGGHEEKSKSNLLKIVSKARDLSDNNLDKVVDNLLSEATCDK